MPYDVCIFDLDGTLTDSYVGVTRAFEHALNALGVGAGPGDPSTYIGPPLHESFKAHGVPDGKIADAVASFREYYGETGAYENEVYPGIEELLQALAQSGAQLAVATSKYGKFAENILEHFDLSKYFGCISGDAYGGSLSKGGKHQIIRIALEAVDPKREKSAVMIGDRHHDILGARELGIDSIGITWGYGTREELEQAGATHIAETPAELLRLILN